MAVHDHLDRIAGAIDTAVALLTEHESHRVNAVGEYIRDDGALLAFLPDADNPRGRSLRLEHGRRVRNQALREAAALGSYSAAELAAELYQYFTTVWLREKSHAENPHPPRSVRGAFWRALKAFGSDLGDRQVARILAVDDE